MNEDPIEAVLSGRFPLALPGGAAPCPIPSLIIEPSLEGRESDLLRTLKLPSSLIVVCDPDTYDAMAQRVAAAVPSATVVVIDAPRADQATVERLIDLTRHAEALVAVGAGTLNDLTKYVSHLRGQPYAVFATAPSMNGYVTATASISRNGEKLSLPATPPKAAFFDLEILAAAPYRLVQAGVGDSLCRTTAEIDWRISHHLFDTAFLEAPFIIQAKDEARLLDRIGGLETGDLDAIQALTRLLVLGGLGMLMTGTSQPGSQGEHLISHYIDMLHRPHPDSLHGEQVGLATRTMATLQHAVLMRDEPPCLAETSLAISDMARRFGARAAPCMEAMKRKGLTADRLDALNERLLACWPVLQASFKARALPVVRLQSALTKAGVAAKPQDLGIDPAFYREAILHARELRDRFTMLDLAADAGVLGPFVEQNLPAELQ